MSLTKEDLTAISDLMDEKLEPVSGRLDRMDGRLDKMDERIKILDVKQNQTAKKLDDLQLDMQIAVRDIRGDIHILNDEMDAVIEVLRVYEMMPR